MKKSILKRVAAGKIKPQEAFDLLYGKKVRRANFVKLSMNIKEERFISLLINILFILPLPIILGKYFILKALKKHDLPKSLYYDAVKNGGGTSINILSNDANINISFF